MNQNLCHASAKTQRAQCRTALQTHVPVGSNLWRLCSRQRAERTLKMQLSALSYWPVHVNPASCGRGQLPAAPLMWLLTPALPFHSGIPSLFNERSCRQEVRGNLRLHANFLDKPVWSKSSGIVNTEGGLQFDKAAKRTPAFSIFFPLTQHIDFQLFVFIITIIIFSTFIGLKRFSVYVCTRAAAEEAGCHLSLCNTFL